MHIHANRVLDVSSSEGTGTIAVSGSPPTGYETFSDRLTDGDTCFIVIQHRTLNEWEVCVAEYVGTDNLDRIHVFASSNGDALVDFGAGDKDVALINPAVNEFGGRVTYTGNHTLGFGDAFRMVEMNVGSANNLTVPANAVTPFPIDTRIDILQVGAGQTTIVEGDTDVVIDSKDGNLNLTGQWSAASLIKRGTDSWVLIGDLAA